MRTGKHLRATLITAAAAVTLLTPIAYLKHLDATRPETGADLGRVAPFLFRDVDGGHFSSADLAGHVTVVASLGAQPTAAQIAALASLTTWIQGHLLYADPKEQTPVRLVAVAAVPVSLPAGWRRVATPDELWTFVPPSRAADGPAVTIIDQTGVRRYHMPLATVRLDQLEPALSKLVINHYMHDYLAKRTFFERQPGEREAGGM